MCQFISAQNDSINKLKEVIVSDRTLYSGNKSQSIQVLNDSVINKNKTSLSSLLNYNSVLYFKEYGRGMLSTVSFRGTTASQTAVIWNGINVNSQLNGSADFNTFTAPDFNTISIKAGGGSVSYGSGAIGGTIHLNNNLVFKDKFENELRLDYGSFNTIGVNYKMNLSNKKWSTQVGFSRNSSDNDYVYQGLYTWEGVQRKNENGQYATTNLFANVGYKVKSNAIVTFYSQSSNTDRNLSLINESDSKTKYVNTFSRNLLEYNETKERFTTNYKVVFGTLEEARGLWKVDGFRTLKEALISAILNKTDADDYEYDHEEFMEASSMSSILANLWLSKVDTELKEDILLPALLQEAGKFILSELLIMKNKSTDFINQQQNDKDIVEIEKEILGTTSSKVTAEIFKHWKLSDKLIDIIEHVDNIPNCKEEYKKHAQILDVIKTACNPTGILSDKNIEKAVKKAKSYNLDTIFLLESIEILNSRLKNNDS